MFDRTENLDTIVREWVEVTMGANFELREVRVKALLQPRPWWLPVWLWHKTIARLLVIEERDV